MSRKTDALEELYNMDDYGEELYDRIYRSKGFRVDEEDIIAKEVLNDSHKIDDLFATIARQIASDANDGRLDNELDSREKERLLRLFDIEAEYTYAGDQLK